MNKEHCDNAKFAVRAYHRYMHNKSKANKFLSEAAYAAYESSCDWYNIPVLSPADLARGEIRKGVIYLPF